MTIRTTLSISTVNIQNAIVETANLDYFGNVSNYLQDLVIKDQMARGVSKEYLMLGVSDTKKRNTKTKKV